MKLIKLSTVVTSFAYLFCTTASAAPAEVDANPVVDEIIKYNNNNPDYQDDYKPMFIEDKIDETKQVFPDEGQPMPIELLDDFQPLPADDEIAAALDYISEYAELFAEYDNFDLNREIFIDEETLLSDDIKEALGGPPFSPVASDAEHVWGEADSNGQWWDDQQQHQLGEKLSTLEVLLDDLAKLSEA